MPNYIVSWTSEVTVATPQDAAEQAIRALQSPGAMRGEVVVTERGQTYGQRVELPQECHGVGEGAD